MFEKKVDIADSFLDSQELLLTGELDVMSNVMFSGRSERPESGPVPKRARVTKSCTSCRQRKIKCDKGKPACGSCTKKGRPHECKYEEPEWSVNVVSNNGIVNPVHEEESVDEQLLLMREKIRQIESAIKKDTINRSYESQEPTILNNVKLDDVEQDGIIDFYKNNHGNPRMFTQGVLSWVTLLKKDAYLNSIVASSRKKKVIITSKQRNDVTEKEYITKFQVEQDFDAEISIETDGQVCKYKNKDIIHLIKNTLKDAKLTWLLVDKFFESELYFVLPLLDKVDFTTQLFDIIGSRSSKKVVLKIKKKLQLTTIGILIIIMRLASLTTYNVLRPNDDNLSESDRYILEHPVTKDVMTVARRCYEEINLFKEAHLEIFQFQLLVRYYDHFAPEDCDCTSIAISENMGPLIHSAVSTGLNRDPSIFESGYKNPNLLRRLWFKVVYLEYNQLMLIGCPPMINIRFYDTDYPHLDPNDSALDYAINQGMLQRKCLYEICHHLLMLILNVREPPRLSNVLQHLKPLETFVFEHSKVHDIMKMPSEGILQRWDKIKLINELIDSTSLLYMIYYHIFLYYNEKGNKEKSVHYLLANLKIMTDAFPLIKFLLKETESNADFNLKKHFGTPIVIIPKIELLCHRCIQLMFSILARIKAMKVFTMDISPQKLDLLDNIAELALRSAAYILKGSHNVSDTYYHAWAMNKMHNFILKNTLDNKRGAYNSETAPESDREFVKDLNSIREHDEIFTSYDMNDLNNIYQALKLLESEGRDSDRSSPSSSVDMTFSMTDTQNDPIWLDQLQTETDILYDSSNMAGSTSSTTTTGLNGIGDPLNLNNNNNTGNVGGSIQDPVLTGFDIMDIERLFYHSTNQSYFHEE